MLIVMLSHSSFCVLIWAHSLNLKLSEWASLAGQQALVLGLQMFPITPRRLSVQTRSPVLKREKAAPSEGPRCEEGRRGRKD